MVSKQECVKRQEDSYEEAYLIIRIALKNIIDKKFNKKFIKIAFTTHKIFLLLKTIINKIKKNSRISKEQRRKKGRKESSYLNYDRTSQDFSCTSIPSNLNFLSKSICIALKYAEKSKCSFNKNMRIWFFRKMFDDSSNEHKNYSNLALKKAQLKFVLKYSKKNKKFNFNMLKTLLFSVCHFRYKHLYKLI